MPKYKYKSMNAFSKRTSGEMLALDEVDLSEKLAEKNEYLIECSEIKAKRGQKSFKAKELSEFCRQLGTLVASGVTLVRALAIMMEEESLGQHQKVVYGDILKMVRQGMPLSEAMEAQVFIFPNLLIHMVHTAEISGNLDRTMMRMAEQYEKEYKLNTAVKSAMTYPKILTVIIIGVVILLMSYVVPQFEELFAQMEVLPASTQLLLAMSNGIKEHWLALLVLVAVVILTISLLNKIPAIGVQKDKLMVRMPLFGKLEKRIYTARFARTLCSLYGSGLPIISCLAVARHTIGNTYIDKQFDEVIAFIRAGGNLSEGLEHIDGFTKKLVSSIKIGEETGHLESMLESTADTLDYEAEMAINQMVSYLEPLMIVVTAMIVGFIMISVIQPIYGSYESIAGTGM